MRKFGLIGYPLGHSFSQKYFTEKFSDLMLTDCVYNNYPLTSLDNFPEFLNSEHDLAGLNVTIPYKSQVIRFLDFIDEEAREIGAVNVLKLKREHGNIKVYGFNSDVKGIRDTLGAYLDNKGGNALILGTGGSSRAVNHVLEKAGMNVTLVSREKKQNCIAYNDLTPALIRKSMIIINTTPLGMFPNTETMPPLDYSALSSNNVLFDLVYNPELTSFLKMGQSKGCVVLSGLKMLYSQAEKSWEIWNNSGF